MSLPFINNDDITVTFFRGNDLTNPVWGPEDIEVNVQAVNFIVRPEETHSALSWAQEGNEYVTHRVYVDMAFDQEDFSPLLDDYLLIEGSLFGHYDGGYVIKQYPRPMVGFDGEIAYFELDCRFMGPKRPGDDGEVDNSDNLRLGSRRRSGGTR